MKRFILIKDKQRQSAIEEINKLPLGSEYEVVIKNHVKKRTDPQNKMYFAWITEIAKQQGSDKDTVHTYFKNKYGYWDSNEFMGHIVAVPISTTKYNTKQFSEYMIQIEAEMAQFGIQLPHPGDEAIMECGMSHFKD